MCKPVFVRGSWFLMGMAILLAAPSLGRAQDRQLAATEDLKKAWSASDGQLRQLVSGQVKADKNDKKHIEAADAAAQWYLYRFTIQGFVTPTPNNPNPVQKMHDEFQLKVAELMKANYASQNGDFRKMFAAELVSKTKDVLRRGVMADPTTVIHVAEMLTDMAKLKQDEVSAYLSELARDNKNPVVQLHAFKALREALPIAIQPTLTPANDADYKLADIHNARKSLDIKIVDALRQFIDAPVNTAGMSPEEIKAVIFVRREAIITLAHAGAPAVVAVPNKKVAAPPEGAVAHTLLNVLAGNLQPPPSMQEKVEAALGLCAMKYPNMPEYEPQVAIYMIGKTVDDFVAEYNKDRVNISLVGAGKKVPYMPFAGDARRLKAELKNLAVNTQGPSAKTAKELETLAAPILDKIIGRNDATRYGQPELDHVQQLKALVAQSLPKTGGYVFKTLKMKEIPLGK